jgi:hypothetical protein
MAPLLEPEDCCILLIDPLRRNVQRPDIRLNDHQALFDRYTLVEEAARILNVPKYFAIYGETVDEREWIAPPCDPTQPRVYLVGAAGSLWASSGIGSALAREGRACLILSGFWLEASVTFAALYALADGFDVFILMDACPSWDPHSQSPAVNRLLQAGVVPLTTTQMVREWAEVATDDVKRTSLLRLLAPT